MKKIYLIYTLFFYFLFSDSITNKQISMVAENFISSRFANSELYAIDRIDKNDFLNIVHLQPKGFLIVSSDNEVYPVLGYSFESTIDLNNLPKQLNEILNKYNQGIEYIISNELEFDQNIENLWNNYIGGSNRELVVRDINPLITANWNQGGQWNNLCPNESLVGCVAVAMGQVMYYWEHPYQGSGYSQYYDPNHGILSVIFDDYVYNYEYMDDNDATYDSQLLLYHAGLSVNMDYSPWASGASVCWEGPSAQAGLDVNFNYHNDINCEVKINYSDEAWHDLIFDQLFRGWPIIYRGYSDDAGHAWNIDGYQDNYFHCNWGWGGSANGYFYFDNLNGGGYNFIDNQAALINIMPDNIYEPVALFEFEVNDKTVLFNNLSATINDDDIEFSQWDFGDMNTSLEMSPEYTYLDYGEYEVTLSVMSEYGLYSENHYEIIAILDLEGDINNDLEVDVIDIVYLVNIILSDDFFDELNDLNQDQAVNILDIILLVQIILE